MADDMNTLIRQRAGRQPARAQEAQTEEEAAPTPAELVAQIQALLDQLTEQLAADEKAPARA